MVQAVTRVVVVSMLAMLAAGTPASAQALQPVLEPYLRIQSQLAGDSIEGVRKDAALAAEAAGRLGPGGTPIASAARELGAATTLEGARKAFGPLSAAILGYAEKTNAALPPDVYAVHCPMARATWLQKGERIRNPHYGQSMLTCGEIKKRPGA